MDRRIGRGLFLVFWAALVGAQLAVIRYWSAFPVVETPMLATGQVPAAGIAALLGLQLAKFPFTAWRLNDLGRPPSDAIFYVLIPVVNVVGAVDGLTRGAPKPAIWEKRRKAWANQIGPFEAVARALPLVGKSAGVVLPVVVVYTVVLCMVGLQVLGFAESAAAMETETRRLLAQGFTGLSVLLAIYTLVQFIKRKTASRLSWFPSLFFFPAALMAGSLQFLENVVEANVQLILLTFIYLAWQMIWMSIGGAGLMVAVTLAAERARKGEPIDAGAILGQLGPRALDVAGPHGARVQAVTVGMQIVIPGIFYMLQLAFTDTIAVLKPESAALKESGQLTWGMRGRLFKLFLGVTVVTMLLSFGLVSLIENPEAAISYMIDPREMTLVSFLSVELTWGVALWIQQVALLLMYHDRVRYLKERRAERKARKEAKKGEVDESGPGSVGDAPLPVDPSSGPAPA